MSRAVTSFLTLSSILAGSLSGFAGKPPARGTETGLEMTVLIHDYAHVPRDTLVRAERQAAEKFREAGVELAWHDCTLNTAHIRRDSSCEQVNGPTKLILRIVPRSEAVPGMTTDKTMGFAVGTNLATVSFQRVEAMAAATVNARPKLLGTAVAHELGHLLLPSIGHSRDGIMRAAWHKEDLEHISMQGLFFTPQQAELIRADVLARANAADLEDRSPLGRASNAIAARQISELAR